MSLQQRFSESIERNRERGRKFFDQFSEPLNTKIPSNHQPQPPTSNTSPSWPPSSRNKSCLHLSLMLRIPPTLHLDQTLRTLKALKASQSLERRVRMPTFPTNTPSINEPGSSSLLPPNPLLLPPPLFHPESTSPLESLLPNRNHPLPNQPPIRPPNNNNHHRLSLPMRKRRFLVSVCPTL